MQVDKPNKKAQVLGEVIIDSGGQTKAACEVFWSRWGTIAQKQGLQFLCDESGSHRDTRSAETDVTIMRSILGNKGRCLNPFVKCMVIDRVNRVNGLLSPASGVAKLWIDPSCIRTIDDLRMARWQENVEPRKVDKSNKMYSHLADALGYSVIVLLGVRDNVIEGINMD